MDLAYFFLYIEYLQAFENLTEKSVNVYSLSINIVIITFKVA